MKEEGAVAIALRLWVDDEREPPDPTWLIARSVNAATRLLLTGLVGELSLDHDLGNDQDGYEIVRWLESHAYHGGTLPEVIRCHSMNPVGRSRIDKALKSISRFTNVVYTSTSGTVTA